MLVLLKDGRKASHLYNKSVTFIRHLHFVLGPICPRIDTGLLYNWRWILWSRSGGDPPNFRKYYMNHHHWQEYCSFAWLSNSLPHLHVHVMCSFGLWMPDKCNSKIEAWVFFLFTSNTRTTPWQNQCVLTYIFKGPLMVLGHFLCKLALKVYGISVRYPGIQALLTQQMWRH